MNGYDLIILLQKKMKDPVFEKKFNKLADGLGRIPNLQQMVMTISQIQDEEKREKAIDKLPKEAKSIVKELFDLLKD